MSEYKFQHYVPRTYLEAWENNNHRLHVFVKENDREFYKLSSEMLGENDFYTLKADDNLVLSDDDRLEIYGDLLNYEISLDDKKLTNLFDISMSYYRFDEWEMVAKDGSEFYRENIKSEIEKKRILDIEKGWHKIESEWNPLRDKIITTMNDKSHNLKLEDGQKLITYITSQKSRNVSKKEEYREVIDSLMNFLKENMTLDEYKKVIDEFSEAYFLKTVRKYQEGNNESLILKEENLMRNLHMVFYRTTNRKKFLTSDNPAFTILDKKFYKGKYAGLYFPINPDLIVALYRGETYRYTRADMPVNMIRRINKYIKESSNRFYIKYDI